MTSIPISALVNGLTAIALAIGCAVVSAQPTVGTQPTPQRDGATPTVRGAPLPLRADPMNAAAPVAPLRLADPFAGYRPFAPQAVGSWPQANEAVRRAGGWRAYAREIAGDAAPDAHRHPAPGGGR